MRRAIAGLALLLGPPLLLAGCRNAAPAGARGSRVQDPSPIALTASLDTANRRTRYVVAGSGAGIATVDSQGTRYHLTIPPHALLFDTDVVLTPLTNIQGMPGQTAHYGVDIEPAGTRLYEPAVLEIEPKQPLPKENVFWLQTEGTPPHLFARPGRPASGTRGVQLWHFSGGTVVSGTLQTSLAVHGGIVDPEGAFHDLGTRDGVEWLQNAIEQDYLSGQMTAEQYDRANEIASERMQEALVNEALAALAQARQAGEQALQNAAQAIESGNLSDAKRVQDAVAKALEAARQSHLHGFDSDLGAKAGSAWFQFMRKMLSKCDTQPLPKEVLAGWERQAQLFGFPSSDADILRCLSPEARQRYPEPEPEPTTVPDDKKRANQKDRVQKAAERVAAYAQSVH